MVKQASAHSRQLGASADDIIKERYRGLRAERTRICQLRGAINTLLEVIGRPIAVITVDDVTSDHLRECVRRWRAAGLANGTINMRLICLGQAGVAVSGQRQRDKLPPKWWLRPDQAADLCGWLRGMPEPHRDAELTADYIDFTIEAGLRVEETLRLSPVDVSLAFAPDGRSRSELAVQGTKNLASNATIALSTKAARVLERRVALTGNSQSARLFPITYRALLASWGLCRVRLGVTANPLATLKALRRTAARNLTANGMPTAVVQTMLRHSSMRTTEGYLQVTGGYTTEEQRKWMD